MNKTSYHSWCTNKLAAGCKQCVLGRKLVVFVTGICPKNCFYCPLSEEKKNKDVIFANERQLINEDDINGLIEEADLSLAYGAGITGGDPLMRIERTCRYITALKSKFGQDFHIHLYTILETITADKLKMLNDAGLDELRLHPDIFDNSHWNKIGLMYNGSSRIYDFKIGIEIPSIPTLKDETTKLIEYFLPKTDFININELEISDTNSQELINNDFHTKDSLSYAVKGSREMALEMIRNVEKKFPAANLHFCTCKLKDGVQLKQRLRIRAENTKKIFDIVDDEGIIMRGAIYMDGLQPGSGYIKMIKNMNSKNFNKYESGYRKIMSGLIKEFGLPANMLEVDMIKSRIITNIGVVQHLSKHLKDSGLIPAIVEQYPTYDQMEVSVEFL